MSTADRDDPDRGAGSMAKMSHMITGLADYTLADLEALEHERPELGRLEVIDGALHATGESAVGNLHQLLMQRLHLLFAAVCPPTHIVRLGTWWSSSRGKIRPDVAVYRAADVPANRRGAGVRRGHLDMAGRFTWWLRLDGEDHEDEDAQWQLDGWPPLRFVRTELFGPEPGSPH